MKTQRNQKERKREREREKERKKLKKERNADKKDIPYEWVLNVSDAY